MPIWQKSRGRHHLRRWPNGGRCRVGGFNEAWPQKMEARKPGPHLRVNDRRQSSNRNLFGLLSLRLLAVGLFELRQLIQVLFRVLLERGRAVRAAEVDFLAFVVHRIRRIDWLAAYGARRLTREAFCRNRLWQRAFSASLRRRLPCIWLGTSRSRSRPWCSPTSTVCSLFIGLPVIGTGDLHDLSRLEQLTFNLQIELLRIRLECLRAIIATEVNLIAVLQLC